MNVISPETRMMGLPYGEEEGKGWRPREWTRQRRRGICPQYF